MAGTFLPIVPTYGTYFALFNRGTACPAVIPSFLHLVFAREKGAAVHLSLLFTARLHSLLFGGAFMCMHPINVMGSQLQDNLTSVIVKIGLNLSYPWICLFLFRTHHCAVPPPCDVNVWGQTDQGAIAVQLESCPVRLN